MYTILKDGAALAEGWENTVRWVPFSDLVKETGTARSFARLPSPESAVKVAQTTGGKVAEVLMQRGTNNFEIVLHRPGTPPPKPVTASGR